MNLDYLPLAQPVTKEDIAHFKASRPNPPRWLSVLTVVLPTIVIGGFLTTIAFIIYLAEGTFPYIYLLFFVAMAIAGVFALRAHRRRIEKLVRLSKFAAVNNIQLLANQPAHGYTGLVFGEGHSQEILEAFVFSDGSEIGNYTYKTGSGKNQQTHNWGYMRVKLSRNLPHMVLDAKKNNLFFGKISNLPSAFDKSQTLSLEGQFNDYFTLYAPKQYEQDALYVFTPDVMAAVIDAGQDYELEVIDNNLMFYTQSQLRMDSEVDLKHLLGIAAKIGDELRDQSSYYADERSVSRAANVVAEPGRRLKSGIGVGGIITIILVIIYIVWRFISNVTVGQ